MLRAANILNASDACRATLEKKIGLQLEQSTLDDLLIPIYSYLKETLYDVDCVQRILAHFLHRVEQMTTTADVDVIDDEDAGDEQNQVFGALRLRYPNKARVYDDGLYRAVDVYLKAHPWLKEADREKICGVMDCRKLTLEACTHAAQNERLPLRAVVQVLFFEQLQLRQAIAGTLMSVDTGQTDMQTVPVEQQDESVVEGEVVRHLGSTWTAAVRENQVLRLDMDSMRTRVHHLERECSTMRKAIAKIDKVDPVVTNGRRGSIWKNFGCKFKTQVCDSQEPTLVQARKTRTHKHLKQQ
ncbi:putative NPH3 domain-containing protein [Helianthus annuus]|uniref:NPH3 domain-containing protein n=1 Tax=Helianthus annuus TaxID=4232 RepID=A0A9K3JZD2_HELAN|nr:putative NPH3 domain-containing protein [Helianthus annuus]